MMVEIFSAAEISQYILLIYLGIVNITGLIYMAVDKNKAIKQSYRIPERILFTIAWTGGSLGILLGMKFFRHKTLHNSFRYGIPVIMVMTYTAAFYFNSFVNNYIVPTVSSLLDQADQGGLFFYALFPFIIDRGTTGDDVFWSSLWIIVSIILVRGVVFYMLSKQMAWLTRLGLFMLNFYALILFVYKGIIGVIHADSIIKVVGLLVLMIGNGFISGFIFGYMDGTSKRRLRDKRLSQSPRHAESEDESLFPLPLDALQNPEKYGLIPKGSARLDGVVVSEEDKVDFPLFGATLYQDGDHPSVCEADINKVFFKSGINVGYEITHVRDLTNNREMDINNLDDLLAVHDDLSIGDELMFRVIVGRGSSSHYTQNIYMKIESHIRLVK